MAISFSVSVDLGDLQQTAVLARAAVFANLSDAVRRVAETGVERWQQAIHAAPGVWSGEAEAYASAIRAHQVGPYAWEIVNDYKFVEDIETGRPPRDLKLMLNTSMKVRVTKSGKRYLIIPFRHNTPGSSAHAKPMPKAIYREASQLAESKITGHHTRPSGTGAWDVKTKEPMRVRARSYEWGGRLAAGLVPKMRKEHRTDRYAGMVRFREASGSSVYLTFRRMSEDSAGWIVPAKPGLWIAKNVSESLQRTASIDLPSAMARDISAA